MLVVAGCGGFPDLLSLQVRASDRPQRSIMQQGRADRVTRAWLTMASAELAIVWQKGIDADAAMTRTESHKGSCLADSSEADYVTLSTRDLLRLPLRKQSISTRTGKRPSRR